jgi:hypothetical protein
VSGASIDQPKYAHPVGRVIEATHHVFPGLMYLKGEQPLLRYWF